LYSCGNITGNYKLHIIANYRHYQMSIVVLLSADSFLRYLSIIVVVLIVLVC